MARNDGGKGHFAAGIAPSGESLEKLAIGQPGDGATIEQRLNLPAN